MSKILENSMARRVEQIKVTCHECSGTGEVNQWTEDAAEPVKVQCPTCGGHGVVEVDR